MVGSLVTFRYKDTEQCYDSRLPPTVDDPAVPVIGLVVEEKKRPLGPPAFVVMWSDEPGRRLSYFEVELVTLNNSPST